MQKMRFQVSLDIVHCDGFVHMPATAQALYIQILSVCDDEGFTSQIEMCKFLAHAKDDDVKTLIEKQFIFQVGERKVTVIKHWKMNTYLHEGKMTPSKFAERSLVYLKENGNYTLDPSEGKPLGQPILESKRSEDGMKTETSKNTLSSRDGQGARAGRAQNNPIQSNPIHNNPLQNNTKEANATTETSLFDDDEELDIPDKSEGDSE